MLKLFIAFLWVFLLQKVLSIRPPLPIEPPLPKYNVEILQWEVPVSLDGRTAILNGTVQQVYQQLLDINPTYEIEFGKTDESNYIAKYGGTPRSSFRALTEVEQRSWSDCGHFDPAKAQSIWEGIYHLSHVSGRPVSIPGPGACGRVSCSYGSAIWWCNDMYTEKTLDSFDAIGISVQLLTGHCAYWSEAGSEPRVSGQHFHPDQWNTIVREAVC